MDSSIRRRKILFLDDRSKRIHDAIRQYGDDDLTIVTNVIECLRYLSAEDWDVVSLDHDLGGHEFMDPDNPNCGMAVVRYLEKTTWPIHKYMPKIIIHSSNMFAAYAMCDRLTRLGFPFVEVQRYEYKNGN